MSWSLYTWTFRLRSPLHVGFHKTMHLFRTRPYAPGKLVWGALTAKLAPLFPLSDYLKTGQALEEVFRFSNLYLYTGGDTLYLPRYTEREGLKFGLADKSLTRRDFEKYFFSSMASTAVKPETFTAEEGLLHQVEFINPYLISSRTDADNFTPVYLRGLLWIKKPAETAVFQVIEKDGGIVLSQNDTNSEVNFAELVKRLQIGGERKYGFGLLELQGIPEQILGSDGNEAIRLPGFPGRWRPDKEVVRIGLGQDEPLWGHVLSPEKVPCRGFLEPLVGRNWDMVKGAGQNIKSEGLAWAPGSLLQEARTFEVTPHGTWFADGGTSLKETT